MNDIGLFFKHYWKTLRYAFDTLRMRGWVELEDCVTGEVQREHWGYKGIWRLRPRHQDFVRRLDCGCAKRFGRVVLFRWKCEEHTTPRFPATSAMLADIETPGQSEATTET